MCANNWNWKFNFECSIKNHERIIKVNGLEIIFHPFLSGCLSLCRVIRLQQINFYLSADLSESERWNGIILENSSDPLVLMAYNYTQNGTNLKSSADIPDIVVWLLFWCHINASVVKCPSAACRISSSEHEMFSFFRFTSYQLSSYHPRFFLLREMKRIKINTLEKGLSGFCIIFISLMEKILILLTLKVSFVLFVIKIIEIFFTKINETLQNK